MRSLFATALLWAGLANAEEISPAVTLVEVPDDIAEAVDNGVMDEMEAMHTGTSEIKFLPIPTAKSNSYSAKPPGKWDDTQKLTLETFKEIVVTDVENVWVVAYIDPRCRDCLILSLEWEKLTQIEEKEMRKIKLGYVDISVEENWKIVQDHTKGKKLTYTPAVGLYGNSKDSPYFYKGDQPTGKGIHTWVSSYADHYGYGYWNPDQYDGAAVAPHYGSYGYGAPGYGSHAAYGRGQYRGGPRGGHLGYGDNGHGYGGYGGKFTKRRRHMGALGRAGVAIGGYGKGYSTGGKWQKGDQVTQLKMDRDSAVARRRTVTTGGKLSGAAHIDDHTKYKSYARHHASPKLGHYGGKSVRVVGNGKHGYGGYRGGSPYGGKSHYGSRGYGGLHRMGGDSYGKHTGTYGSPYTSYKGPGYGHLKTFVHPKLGKGIVLGKYARTSGGSKRAVQFSEDLIAGPADPMYRDAYDLALRQGHRVSRRGPRSVSHGPSHEQVAAIIPEDSPQLNMPKAHIPDPMDMPSTHRHGHKVETVADYDKLANAGYNELEVELDAPEVDMNELEVEHPTQGH